MEKKKRGCLSRHQVKELRCRRGLRLSARLSVHVASQAAGQLGATGPANNSGSELETGVDFCCLSHSQTLIIPDRSS